MKRTWFAVIVLMFFAISLAVFAEEQSNAGSAEVTAPRLIKVSGTLKDPTGPPREGLVVMNFALYSSQEGGAPLWQESQLVNLDAEGHYSIFLGASEKDGLPLDLFSVGKAQWLGVQAEGTEEQARFLLAAVPYALKAADTDTVGGVPVSSLVLNQDLLEAGGDFNVYAAILQQRGLSSGTGQLAARNSSSKMAGGSPVLQTFNGVPVGGIGAPVLAYEGLTNTFYGLSAGNGTMTGYDNSFFGSSAGHSDTGGGQNCFFGKDAGYSNSQGWNNNFFGQGAGYSNTSGMDNNFVGIMAGYSNTTGNSNNYFGRRAGYYNTTGEGNSFFGHDAGEANTGSYNTFVGLVAGINNEAGANNCFFGLAAGGANTTGNENSFFGAMAGTSNTTEHRNTMFGYLSDGATGVTNATAIGYRAKVTQSNSLVLGGVNGQNGATAETNVGIGVTNPDRQLTVEGTQALARFRRYYGTDDPFTRTFAPAFLFERARPTQAAPTDILAGDYLGKVQFHGRVAGNQIPYGAIAFIASDTGQNGRFAFLDRDITTERMSILNTGNVGIGTSNPTEALQVVGNIRVSGDVLYGPSEGLNLVGDWEIADSGSGGGQCGFYNVWDLNEPPHCGAPSGEPPRPFFTVTVQEGTGFAGTFPWQPGSKLTGAIGEDGTFVMQAWISNNRMFISGRFSLTQDVLKMKALANQFEDWMASTPSMYSSSFTFRKVN